MTNEMVKCKCGRDFVKGTQKCPWCDSEVASLVATKEDDMHGKLYNEYLAAFKEQEDTSIVMPVVLMIVGGLTFVFLIGVPIFLIGGYLLLVNLFSKGAKQAKLDRARDRLEAFEEKHGYN